MHRFLTGAGYVWRGMQLIRTPKLRRYVLVPLGVNCLLFGTATILLFDRLGVLVEWLTDYLPHWLAWLRFLLWPLLVATALMVCFYGFILVANLLAAPFNGVLSAAVQRHLTGTSAVPDINQSGVLKEAVGSVASELHKLGYFVLRAVPMGILFLIPVANLLAAPLWALFSAWMLAVEYADYPMGNQGMKFSRQRKLLREQPLLTIGFGSAVLFITIIPLLNLVAMPAAVAGATVMWLERFRGQPGKDGGGSV